MNPTEFIDLVKVINNITLSVDKLSQQINKPFYQDWNFWMFIITLVAVMVAFYSEEIKKWLNQSELEIGEPKEFDDGHMRIPIKNISTNKAEGVVVEILEINEKSVPLISLIWTNYEGEKGRTILGGQVAYLDFVYNVFSNDRHLALERASSSKDLQSSYSLVSDSVNSVVIGLYQENGSPIIKQYKLDFSTRLSTSNY